MCGLWYVILYKIPAIISPRHIIAQKLFWWATDGGEKELWVEVTLGFYTFGRKVANENFILSRQAKQAWRELTVTLRACVRASIPLRRVQLVIRESHS